MVSNVWVCGVVCGVWCVVCGAWCVVRCVCGVCGVCGVWCVVCIESDVWGVGCGVRGYEGPSHVGARRRLLRAHCAEPALRRRQRRTSIGCSMRTCGVCLCGTGCGWVACMGWSMWRNRPFRRFAQRPYG